ncbi:hypothetical protein [Candidatus Weimeria sp. HCP3S3_B5]|uniref:hypothetical protein n=1 Tax=Candidatus Weimeria sp. HCP3S3_B5 TaxID=3438871 RepID=UPI003F8CAD96
MEKSTRRVIVALIAVSALIYAVQIAVFHDVRTTAFYFLQDMAFMPITIAIATIVVGEIISLREKRERLEKTQMLTSSFFTGIGAYLLKEIIRMTDTDQFITEVVRGSSYDKRQEKEILDRIRKMDLTVHIDREGYDRIRQIIRENQTNIFIIASNPLVIEHEAFTDMLWGIFHLMDEYRLRGDWDDLSAQDIEHFDQDFERILRAMLINWVRDVRYLRENFPDFYAVAGKKIGSL